MSVDKYEDLFREMVKMLGIRDVFIGNKERDFIVLPQWLCKKFSFDELKEWTDRYNVVCSRMGVSMYLSFYADDPLSKRLELHVRSTTLKEEVL